MRISELKELVSQDELPYTFTVLDPNGDPYTNGEGESDVSWSVIGTQSKARRKAEDDEARKLLRAGRSEMEPQDLRDRRITLAVSCSTAFAGFTDEDGSPLVFNKHNARTILAIDERILSQVEKAIERHSSFLSKASISSESTSDPRQN